MGLFGKSIINDMMGVGGAAAEAFSSRPAIAIPKPPLRARFHCIGPNHHDGHYEDSDMHTCFHPEFSCHAGRELRTCPALPLFRTSTSPPPGGGEKKKDSPSDKP